MKTKKIFATLLAAVMLVNSLTIGASAASSSFTDVPDGAWYGDAVDYAVEHGLFAGTSATTFSPYGTMTRAMFVVVLGRMSGDDVAKAASAGFTDVDAGAWYADAINWAKANGYVNGTGDTTFSPDNPITREQIATILYNYLSKTGAALEEISDPVAVFRDAESIGSYAADGVDYMRRTGLMAGDNVGNFNPKNDLTRCEAATVFMRLCQKLDVATGGNIGSGDNSSDNGSNGNDSAGNGNSGGGNVDNGNSGGNSGDSGTASGATTFAKAGEGTLETPSMSISDVKDVVEHDVQKGPVYGVSDPGLLAVGAPMGAMGEVEQCRYIEAAPGIIGTLTTYYAHLTAGSNSYYRRTDIRVDLADGESITVDCRDFGHDPSDGYWDIQLCENAVDHGDGRVTITKSGDYDTAFFDVISTTHEHIGFGVYTDGIKPLNVYE